jgi:hypothetical protein
MSAALFVRILHILLVLWVIFTPFTQNEPMLILHLFAVPSLWLHWYMMDDTCSLWLLEMKLRGLKETHESFFYNLVSPVYKIRDDDIRVTAWWASIALWLITLAKVMGRPEMIRDVFRHAMHPSKYADRLDAKPSIIVVQT